MFYSYAGFAGKKLIITPLGVLLGSIFGLVRIGDRILLPPILIMSG
jgi:hypothetical protein